MSTGLQVLQQKPKSTKHLVAQFFDPKNESSIQAQAIFNVWADHGGFNPAKAAAKVQAEGHALIALAEANPRIYECDPMSVLSAVLKGARAGLELSEGHYHLVPFKNRNGTYTATYITDYKAMISLAYSRCGVIIEPPVFIYPESDFYEDADGIHYRNTMRGFSEDELLGLVINWTISGKKPGTWLDKGTIYTRHRAKSAKYNSSNDYVKNDSIWVKDPQLAFIKTMYRHCFKYIPGLDQITGGQEAQDTEQLDNTIEI